MDTTCCYIDIDGNPVDLLRWAELFEDRTYGLIAHHTVERPEGEQANIVTLWHGHRDPVFDVWPFYTLGKYMGHSSRVFGVYMTRAEAEAGHRAVVDTVFTRLGEMLAPE